jgi:hypothetical protein
LIIAVIVPCGTEDKIKDHIADDSEAQVLLNTAEATVNRYSSNLSRHLDTFDAQEFVLECVTADLLDLGDVMFEVVHCERETCFSMERGG